MAKINEDGLVNATHTERLSQRDSEPSHLKGGSYDDLGGTGIDSEPNSVKIDASRGVKGQDTSIIGAGQNSEKSNLKTEGEDDVEVSFDGEDDKADDVDKELDQFEDVEPVDVDVEVSDDEDKKKDVKEDFNFDKKDKDEKEIDEDEEAGEAAGKMKSSASGPESAMNSGPNKVTEGELPPWLKKGDDKEEKAEKVDEDEIVIKKGDDSDDKKDDDKGEKKDNPFEKKEKVDESLRISIRRPNVKLLEAAGIPAASQRKVSLIFETVIKDVTTQVAKQVHAHYKKLHESKLAKRDVVLAKQMNAYLDYVVEEWVKSNRVPIRTALKSQLAEEFLSGFQKLMKEHYIEVPESKVNVVTALSAQVAALKKSLTEQTTQKLKLRQIAEAANKAKHVAQFVRNGKLSEAQAAKLDKLVEGVAYTNSKDFKEKLGMLSESYFGTGVKKPVAKVAGTEGGQRLSEEKIEESKDSKTTAVDPDVQMIADTLKRQSDARKW